MVLVLAVLCVEPSAAYYEKVSEELERIVKEVKDSPVDEGQLTFAASIQNSGSTVAAEGTVLSLVFIHSIIDSIKNKPHGS